MDLFDRKCQEYHQHAAWGIQYGTGYQVRYRTGVEGTTLCFEELRSATTCSTVLSMSFALASESERDALLPPCFSMVFINISSCGSRVQAINKLMNLGFHVRKGASCIYIRKSTHTYHTVCIYIYICFQW